jgi:phage baseplate assembly protein V
MIEALKQAVRDAHRRAMMSIARGILTAINDAPMAQEVQIQLLADEVADQIERFQEYGFTSVPFPQAEAVMVCVGGLRGHGVVIATEDRRYRLKALSPGEVAIYDDQGQAVHLKRDGIYLATTMKVQVDAQGEVIVNAPTVSLAATGGPAVARVGDQVNLETGLIETGSAKVTCA